MQITLIGKRSIYKLILPEIPIGNYWISDKTGATDKNLLNINGNSDFWQITSNNNTKIINLKAIDDINDNTDRKIKIDSSNIIETATLKEYETFGVYLEDLKELFI